MRPARFPVLGGLALCAALLSCGGPPGPTAPSLSSFSVTPSSLLSGVATDVTFSFSYDNTPTPPVSCTIDGVGSVTDGRQTTLTLTANTTFTLHCSNAAGESTKDASVTVVQPVAPQLSTFSANPSSAVVGTPTDVTWTWQYSNTPVPLPTCSIDRNVGTVTSGATTSVTISNTSVFTLTCSNVAGTATKYVFLTAVPATVAPSISAFLAIPSSVVAGAPTSVKWSWTYSTAPTPAPTCSIDQGVGTVTNASSTTLMLASNTTYTLTCVNSAGTGTRQTTVMVSPPVGPTINGFTASPSTVVSGVSTNVTWSWTYSNSPVPAPACSIDQGVGALTNGAVRSITITADTVFTLTCTNTGGTSTRQVTVTLAPPTAPAIATFSASPNFVGQGIPTNIQWNWTYSATPNPTPTCSIDQSVGAVTNGQVTQVNLTAATTYTLTCTNVGGTGTGTTTISIVPVSNGITNGTFETGSLAGWTVVTGSNSAVTGGHGGTYAARTGLVGPTAGDSSISQTFTTAAGVTSLTFWYKVVCLDSVTYDWGTATLRNNSTSVTTTVLARQCSNSGLWQQVTTSVTGNTSYTLTLTNHDDNLSADPTYTLYDDVTLQ